MQRCSNLSATGAHAQPAHMTSPGNDLCFMAGLANDPLCLDERHQPYE